MTVNPNADRPDGGDVWRGVAIEAGFEDSQIPERTRIVGTRLERLEAEDERGEFRFHSVEVPDSDLPEVAEEACRKLRPSWYFHLVKGDEMRVLFRGRAFEVTRNDAARLQAVRQYGMEHGIPEEQLQLERLFDNPFD